MIAVFILVIAKFQVGPGWFFIACDALQTMGVVYLLCCLVASARIGNYFKRKIAEQEAIVMQGRVTFPRLDPTPTNAAEMEAALAKFKAECEANIDRSHAAFCRVEELLRDWSKYP